MKGTRMMTVVGLRTAHYEFGTAVLAVSDEDGDGHWELTAHTADGPEVLSASLYGFGITPAEGCIFVRDYNEHCGLARSLVECGVGRVTRRVDLGYGDGFEVRLTL